MLDLVELVLVMTVNPGFGGQDYIASMEPKVAEASELVLEAGLDIDVEVDGGIGPTTVQSAASAGANVLVAGSALYRHPLGLRHAVSELRELAVDQKLRASPEAALLWEETSMGISDKVNEQLDKVKEKVADLVDQHDEKIEATIDKTADLADEKTGGKHTDKIKSAADKAKGVVDSLGGGDKPAGSA